MQIGNNPTRAVNGLDSIPRLRGGNIQASINELRQAISTNAVEKTSVSKAWVIAKLSPSVKRVR